MMLSQGRPPGSTKASPAPPSQERPPVLPLTAITTDTTFAKQLRAALDQSHEVQIVATPDAAAELAVSGRCPILITDIPMARSALDALTARLRSHDPATAIIVAGNRDQGGMFIGWQSSGAVDGFLLKPVTAAATQLVIEAATRRYLAHGSEVATASSRRLRQRSPIRKERSLPAAHDEVDSSATIEAKRAPASSDAVATSLAAPSVASVAPRVQPSWVLVAIVALGVLGGAWWLTTQRASGIDPHEIAAKHLALGDRAFTAGRLLAARDGAVHHYQTVLAVDPQNFAAQAGLDRIAQELSRQTQTHMAQQRLADAALSLERLRELQPEYPELPLLNSQLRVLQDAILASRTPATTTPPVQQATPVQQNPPRRGASNRAQPTQIEVPSNPARTPARATAAVDIAAPASADVRGISSPAIDQNTIAQPTPQAPAIQAPATVAPVSPEMTQLGAAEQLADASSARGPVPARTQPEAAPATAVAPEALQPPPAKSATPALLKYVPPVYPKEAFARRMEGWIEVSMEITPNGDVLDPRIENGAKRQLFGRAALAAVRQWKYAPDATRSAGTRSSVRLEFKLN